MTIPGCITTGSTAVGHKNGEQYGAKRRDGTMACGPVLEAADPCTETRTWHDR